MGGGETTQHVVVPATWPKLASMQALMTPACAMDDALYWTRSGDSLPLTLPTEGLAPQLASLARTAGWTARLWR